MTKMIILSVVFEKIITVTEGNVVSIIFVHNIFSRWSPENEVQTVQGDSLK